MSKVIKAGEMVLGQASVTIASAPWATAGWTESAAAPAWEDDGVGGRPWPEGRDVEGEEAGAGCEAELLPELTEAQREAEELLQRAREEADRLVAEARCQAETVLTEAREEGRSVGYQDGYRDGLQQGEQAGRTAAEAALAATVTQAERVLAVAMAEQSRIIAASRELVLKLIEKVAEKIIRTQVRQDAELIQRTVEAALQLVTDRNQVRIRVNQEELAKAREGLPSYLRYFGTSAAVEVCGDPGVIPGGCVIETAAGNVDARLETQLDEVMEELGDWVHGS